MVYISGKIYTARDEAHIRMKEYGDLKKPLPFETKGCVIYHCGPVIKDMKVVAAGPTTSDRMTNLTPGILKSGNIRAIIGKGGMKNLGDVMKENKCVYLSYTGGCAALACDMIKSVSNVFWEDLGMAEAVWEFEVETFGPLIVGIDTCGNDLFLEVIKKATKVYESIK